MNEYYKYLILAAIYVPLGIISLMMVTLFVSILASIKTGFSGKFILHKKHPIYFMRYVMMFPQALFLAVFFKDCLGTDITSYLNGEYIGYGGNTRWQIAKNLSHDYVLRELNLCKIFWSQLVSIVVFLPINLAFLALAIPAFILIAPPVLVIFLIWKTFILMVMEILDVHKNRKNQLSIALEIIKKEREEYDRLEEQRRQRAIERGELWTKRWEFFRDVIYRRILCPTFEYVENDKKK